MPQSKVSSFILAISDANQISLSQLLALLQTGLDFRRFFNLPTSRFRYHMQISLDNMYHKPCYSGMSQNGDWKTAKWLNTDLNYMHPATSAFFHFSSQPNKKGQLGCQTAEKGKTAVHLTDRWENPSWHFLEAGLIWFFADFRGTRSCRFWTLPCTESAHGGTERVWYQLKKKRWLRPQTFKWPAVSLLCNCTHACDQARILNFLNFVYNLY